MSKKSYNSFFMNFANKTKFNIIMALQERPLSVQEIAEITGEEQSAVSHSLKKLSQCHILDVKKDGKKRVYSVNSATVSPMLELIKKHVKTYCVNNCCPK